MAFIGEGAPCNAQAARASRLKTASSSVPSPRGRIRVSRDLHASGIGGRLSTMEPNEILAEIRIAAERDPWRVKELESLVFHEDHPKA